MTAIVLAALLTGPIVQTPPQPANQPRLFQGLGGKPIVPVFIATASQPAPSKRKHTIKTTHRSAPLFGQRSDVDRDVVCGTVVLKHRTPTDSGIFMPPRDTGAAARRIEPDVCRTPQTIHTPR